MDGLFVGHVGEFNRGGRALLVPPGAHRIRIALPGYVSFEADINPQPDQKVEIKTDLLKSRVPINDALLAPGENVPPADAEQEIRRAPWPRPRRNKAARVAVIAGG